MQQQIEKFNIISSSDKYDDDVREYAKAMAKVCWTFETMFRDAEKNNKEMEKMFNLKR